MASKVTIKYGNTTISEFTDSKTVTLPTNGKLMGGGDITVTLDNSRLPAGYTEVEYIESSGTQYIDTGLTPNNSLNIDMKVYDTSYTQNSGIIGIYTSISGTVRRLFFGKESSTTCNFGYLGNFYSLNANLDSLKSVQIDCQSGIQTVKIDGTTYHTGTISGILSFSQTLPLFARKNIVDSTETIVKTSCKISYVTITNNNVLSRIFIPCYRKSDSVAGMYDMVNKVFYTNSGTGTFLVGPDVN